MQINTKTIVASMVAVSREMGWSIPFDTTIPNIESEQCENPLVVLARISDHLGFGIKPTNNSKPDRVPSELPCLALLSNGNAVVVKSHDVEVGKCRIYDPLVEGDAYLDITDGVFLGSWSGVAVTLTKNVDSTKVVEFSHGGWIRGELKPFLSEYRGVVAAAFIVNVLSLVSPFFLMVVLDKVVAHSALTTLTVLGVAVVTIVIFESIFDYLRNIVSLSASKSADLTLQTKLYSLFLGLQYSTLKMGQRGIWARVLTEPERIRGFLTNRVLSTGIDLLFVFIFAIALCWMSFELFLITLAAAIIQLLIGFFISPLIRHRINGTMGAENIKEAFLNESIASIDILKAMGGERTNYRKWKSIATGSIENRHKLQTLLASVRGVSGFVDKISGVLIVWVGAILVMSGETTVGILVAANILSKRITSPIMQLSSLVNDFYEIRASSQQIDKIVNEPQEQDASSANKLPIRLNGEFDLCGVRFRYPTNQNFEVSFDIKIEQNTTVALVGASGSGKSTFTRLLLGLVTPSEGVVRVDGNDLRNLDLEVYRSQTSSVLQDTFLFRGTVRENIAFGNQGMSLENIVEAARNAGADEFIQMLPEGYNTFLEENANNISGGQKQRLALARAIARKPRILILDEATSALDPESESIIINNLKPIRKNKTVIIVSHRLSAVVDADLILFMERGKITHSGTHESLLKTCSSYRELWGAQTGYHNVN